ncbi:hypothetical protein BJX99DRAFT_221125 [Aspergillus californicus]
MGLILEARSSFYIFIFRVCSLLKAVMPYCHRCSVEGAGLKRFLLFLPLLPFLFFSFSFLS